MEKWRYQRNQWLRRHGFVDEHGWADYSAYVRSPHWKEFRKRYFATHTARCAICGATNNPLILHHLRYTTIGREHFDDVAALCRRDHDLVHDKPSTGAYVFKGGLVALQYTYREHGDKRLDELHQAMIDRRRHRDRTHTGRRLRDRRMRVIKASSLTAEERSKYGF